MAVFTTERSIPPHEAKPIDACDHSGHSTCVGFCGYLAVAAVVCVTALVDYSLSDHNGHWFDLQRGDQFHLCASCYRRAFGAE